MDVVGQLGNNERNVAPAKCRVDFLDPFNILLLVHATTYPASGRLAVSNLLRDRRVSIRTKLIALGIGAVASRRSK